MARTMSITWLYHLQWHQCALIAVSPWAWDNSQEGAGDFKWNGDKQRELEHAKIKGISIYSLQMQKWAEEAIGSKAQVLVNLHHSIRDSTVPCHGAFPPSPDLCC